MPFQMFFIVYSLDIFLELFRYKLFVVPKYSDRA